MKQSRIIICLVAVLLCVSGGAYWTTSSSQEADSSKVTDDLVSQIITVNLGDVPPNTLVERSIPIQNASPDDLKVAKLHADCGCVKKSISQQSIPPGHSASLSVSYRSPSIRGPFSHRVNIDYENGKSTIVSVAGSVGAWFDVDTSFLSFGSTMRGNESIRTVTVTIKDAMPLEDRVEEFTMQHGRIIDVTLKGQSLIYRLGFSPPDDSKYGECRGELLLGWNDQPGKAIRLPCSGEVVPLWSTYPRKAFFGLVPAGEKRSMTVIARKRSADAEHSELQVKHDLGKFVDVELTAPAEEKPVTAVTIHLKAPEHFSGRIVGEITFQNQNETVLVLPLDAYVE